MQPIKYWDNTQNLKNNSEMFFGIIFFNYYLYLFIQLLQKGKKFSILLLYGVKCEKFIISYILAYAPTGLRN